MSDEHPPGSGSMSAAEHVGPIAWRIVDGLVRSDGRRSVQLNLFAGAVLAGGAGRKAPHGRPRGPANTLGREEDGDGRRAA